MAETIVSTDDLTVLGGPASVSVDVDFGPQGDRGSYIFLSLDGNPNDYPISETPQAFDLCINMHKKTSPYDDEYLQMYQYVNEPSGGVWVKLFKLVPDIYNLNNQYNFDTGETTIYIPIINMVPETIVGTVTADNFNVQYSVLGSNPISSSLSVGEIDPNEDILKLPLTIKAVEYTGGNWVDLDGDYTVHLLITVI